MPLGFLEFSYNGYTPPVQYFKTAFHKCICYDIPVTRTSKNPKENIS